MLERLCFETNEFEEILPNQEVYSYEDVEGEVGYESKFKSLPKDDSIENEEMYDFDNSTKDDNDNEDDNDKKKLKFLS